MNVLSLFDGISVGQLAMKRAGLSITNYYASEIDKFAIFVTNKNFPNTKQLGDVKNWRSWDIEWDKIDLLLSGFPCPSWSIAGKKLGVNDPRGELVYVLVDILNHLRSVNPKFYFLIENVQMKNEHLKFINDLFGCHPTKINSSCFSPQNRIRYYWSNITFDLPKINLIPLEYILDKVGDFEIMSKEKSDYLLKLASLPSKDRKLAYKNRSILDDVPINVPPNSFIYSNHLGQNGKLFKGICATLTCNHPGNVTFLTDDGLRIRKLTPTECEKLQTLQENYTSGISNSSRYKAIGNAWTCDVIAHIFKYIKGSSNE